MPRSRHACQAGWTRTPLDLPAPYESGPTFELTARHRFDAPGTVRACGECGRTWVAVPSQTPGMVFWAPEKRRARRKRERSGTAALPA